jgi:hypothetical protein
MFPNKQTVGSVMPGGTASASESPRPDDIRSCSSVEHLSLHRWSFLKILDIFRVIFLMDALQMGGCGVPSHVIRSCPVAPHVNRSSPGPAHVIHSSYGSLMLIAVGRPHVCHYGRFRILHEITC